MESKDELKEIGIKNCTCYYFDNIIRVWDANVYSNDISLDEKLCKGKYENILIYHILDKTSTGAKPLRIRFDKIDGFIQIHDKVRYLVLFDYSYCDEICDKIKYLISEKSGITDSINHNFARTRIDSYDYLPIEKILTFHSVIILFKSVVNKNKNNYYYNVFLKKGSYKDKSNTEYFKWIFVNYKCYISIELRFLKELMLIKQVHQKSVIFVTIDIS